MKRPGWSSEVIHPLWGRIVYCLRCSGEYESFVPSGNEDAHDRMFHIGEAEWRRRTQAEGGE